MYAEYSLSFISIINFDEWSIKRIINLEQRAITYYLHFMHFIAASPVNSKARLLRIFR